MFLYSHWLNLSIKTRMKIAEDFGIKKSGPTHVNNNVVQSDGYSVIDVEKSLTIESLQRYLETEDGSMSDLWNKLIDKVEGRTPPVEEVVTPTVLLVPEESIKPVTEITQAPIQTPIINKPKSHGRKTKETTKE